MNLAGVLISQGDTVASFVTGDRDAIVSGDPNFRTAKQPENTPQDLLRQIDSAREVLETQLDALRSVDPMHLHQDVEVNAAARLMRLNLLRDQLVGGTNGMPLAALRAEIASAVAATLAYTSQVSSATIASQATTAQQAALHEASANVRQSVSDFTRDFYERRIFDPYLRFTSAEDEEAYRRREEERRLAIDKAQAENTPEGNLRANRLAIEQLRDAGAHGADRSPEYRRRMDELVRSGDALDTAIGASRTTSAAQNERPAPSATVAADPLASVGAKLTDTKGAAAVLLAAGISTPQSDNLGHGVNDRATQQSSVMRAT